jgi:hypothetical protein
VPLEWNIFMIFGLLFLFGHYGDTSFSTVDDPLLLAILAVTCVGLPVLGNFRPDLVSFLPSMRYYAGNWATSQWLFRKGRRRRGEARRRAGQAGADRHRAARQVLRPGADRGARLQRPRLPLDALARRALNGLVQRAVDDVEDYDVREGELVAGVVLGYNFGDGHFHDQRCWPPSRSAASFEPGDVRVVVLESQPRHVQRQRYRIFDAADGPGRGGLGRTSPTWSSASPGSTSGPSRSSRIERRRPRRRGLR